MKMSRRSWFVLVAASLAAGPLSGQVTDRAPYRDPSLPVDVRVRDLLGRMTPEEKFWQLFMIPGSLDDSTQDYSQGVFGLQIATHPEGTPAPAVRDAARAHAERIDAIQKYFVEKTRLGIPIIPFEEAVHGLGREGATSFPQAIGLAATFDTALVGDVATAIAEETRSRGIRQVLSPVINIANDVRWGRVEETYGEDPYLSSRMAVAFVGAMQRNGVIATPKHFIANVGDGGRDSYPIDYDERWLDEEFYPPFKAAITRAGAGSVMASYNSVDGDPASQNHALLTDKLRGDWGFKGFVISDQSAVGGATVLHHTEASTATATKDALNAGLDVIFQSSYPQYRPYWNAFRSGMIDSAVIDSAVARVLRAKIALGLFEHPYVDPESAAVVNGSAAHLALARRAADEAIVLMKNARRTLPLSKSVKSIAVIGEDASEARLGGYSGPGVAKISILDGIREKLGGARVTFVAGPGRVTPEVAVVPGDDLYTTLNRGVRGGRGVTGEYFDNITLSGASKISRVDERVDFGWTLNSPGRGIPFDWYSVRWTGMLVVPKGGVHRIGVQGNDGYRLYLDGKLVIDDWKKLSVGTRLADVHLAPGSVHDLRLEYFESTGNARVKLVWDAGVPNVWRAQIDSAVRAARASDVAVVVPGIEEGEFRDRAFLGLPGHQEELIERVAATGKPVVVVLVGGSAITMNRWIDRVAVVIDAWYPGEQGGRAVADVLFGDANPAGRLPITFPVSEGQLPLIYNHKPTGRGDDYLDLTGQAAFPFGFGLSYSQFEYSNLVITPDSIAPAGAATVGCRVKNVSDRAGDEVVQLYIHDNLASVARPVMMLEGFRRVHLEPGEEREVSFTLSRDELEMLDRGMHWIVEPGSFRVMVGASSKDIRLRGELVVQ
ncbi:MAG TPA: glycoside hydrolase family 3 N-terminal domain-containing protein [Gemmatimonadaceae bacterium]|nr:glycoside hydrolase family 3 N-terminal domain-containing protein [Gemmatimonadaceae bacterium]